MTKRQSITAAVVFAISAAVAWWRHNVRLSDHLATLDAALRIYSDSPIDAAIMTTRAFPQYVIWEIAAFTMIVFAVAALAVGLLAERKTEES